MTQAREVCVVTMIDVMVREILFLQFPHAELLTVGILTAEQTHLIPVITIMQMSTVSALGVTHLDTETTIPADYPCYDCEAPLKTCILYMNLHDY